MASSDNHPWGQLAYALNQHIDITLNMHDIEVYRFESGTNEATEVCRPRGCWVSSVHRILTLSQVEYDRV